VIFRTARGTGLRGLGGIPEKTQSGLIRPLLPFWRSELREYAERQGLDWLTDPTNATLLPVRNRIRHSILPALEREVSPAARRHLVELARLARESERGWLTIVQQAAR